MTDAESPPSPARRAAALHMVRLAAVAGTALFLAGATDPKSVALLGVQFLNDHEGLEPTTDAERARLAAIEALFKQKLEASGRYGFVTLPAAVAAKVAEGPMFGSCGGCEFRYGAEAHADLVAWLVVQKVSDLILNINVYMADIATRKLTFVHSVDIRGNTDESWTRGISYLIKNYLLADAR
jgi:Protein of unknown function (DUF2380)